jgi:phosphate uptake regulator
MTMELRKIQVTGGSTHVVSLPKKWVDRTGLGRSDTVAIHEEPDGSLLLIPHSEGRAQSRTLTVQLPDNPSEEEVVRRLVGAYLAGADEIHIRSAHKMDPKVRQTVRDITRDLVGVEILEESASAMVLQDLVGVADMDLRKTLTRMQRIARIMFDDAVAALHGRDAAGASDVAERDDELDRLLWMVSKQMHALLEQPRLAAKLSVRPAEALNLFLAARALERMGDHAAKMGTNIAALEGHTVPKPVVESLVQQANTVRTMWDDAFASLKRPDFAQASAAADRGEAAAAWRVKFPNLVRGLDHETVGPLTLIADSIDRTRGYAIDLAETAMNQTFQTADGAAPPR